MILSNLAEILTGDIGIIITESDRFTNLLCNTPCRTYTNYINLLRYIKQWIHKNNT
jgi:hypothetical protein